MVYKTPNLDRLNPGILYHEITKASRSDRVCIVGDFNFRDIDWKNITGDGDSQEFLEMVQDNFLYQNVLVPTRGENILDLVLSNRKSSHKFGGRGTIREQ